MSSQQAHRIEILPSPKRVRVIFADVVIADSTQVQLLREPPLPPVYYFPRRDVRTELLEVTSHSSRCPFKGQARYWNIRVEDQQADNAVWCYEQPDQEPARPIAGHLAFYWEPMSAWYEEDEQVFVHPRDPKVRIDIRASARPVKITLGGEVLADSRNACFLFQTGLHTAYYLPREDVRLELLEPSATRTRCPYKGEAHHYSARLKDHLITDVAWSYPDPYPEALPVQDLIAFYPDRVDTLYVDKRAAVAVL
ncbi:MAG: DUF427 domain-containing protein [Candidatus Competibacteraceae bacterium]|nr:DUF427 domain-containing protein [Candidatus Competibacteraceae bacterium]